MASGYRPRIAVLASRDRLCVHEKSKELGGKALQRACTKMQNEGKDTASGAFAADQSAHRRLKFSRCPAARQLASYLEMYGGTPKVFQVARAVSIGEGGRRRLLLPEDGGAETAEGVTGPGNKWVRGQAGRDASGWGAAGALAATAMRGGLASSSAASSASVAMDEVGGVAGDGTSGGQAGG